MADAAERRPLLDGKDIMAPPGGGCCPTWPCKAAFFAIFLACTLPAWVFAAFTDTCCNVPRTAAEHRRRARFLGHLMKTVWRSAFRLCCWIRIDGSGLAPLDQAGRTGRKVFIAANHSSFLDSPMICALAPSALIGDLKALMARIHFSMPIVGRLAKALGFMPVPFRSSDRGNFAVDKDKLAELMARVDEHLANEGHLVLFPEGDTNRNWRQLLTFRAGGLEIAIRHDMEVWAWVMAGTANCWPVGEALGGRRATVRCAAAPLYASAREAGERLAGPGASVRDQAVAMAEDMRSRMQTMMDGLLAA